MSHSSRRPVLSWCCGILMLVLWYFAREQWSGQAGRFYVGLNNSYSDGFEARDFGGAAIGDHYFFGGTFLLIIGAAWMILPQFKKTGMAEPHPAVPLAAAGFGAVALLRWYSEYREKLAWFESTRQRAVSYGMSEAAAICILAVGALAIAGGLYWLVGRSRAATPPPIPPPAPDAAAG